MVTIHPWNSQWATHFKTLNIEWLEKYFHVEAIDEKVLSNPHHIIDQGGSILFAAHGDAIIGCCALLQHQSGVFELTKMAVTANQQGLGTGRLLLQAVIDEFKRLNGKLLYLESHSSLKTALRLYEKYGFSHKPHPFKSKYSRSDVYMEWLPDA
ncbi:GNAT family N-acetyltransferase [Marinicella sp. W31]|uniref:GNAT family N-acetyltransferase n=1 Tax=Marinicella sp. W31 TaxID=3023713 RepID=UPI003756376D